MADSSPRGHHHDQNTNPNLPQPSQPQQPSQQQQSPQESSAEVLARLIAERERQQLQSLLQHTQQQSQSQQHARFNSYSPYPLSINTSLSTANASSSSFSGQSLERQLTVLPSPHSAADPIIPADQLEHMRGEIVSHLSRSPQAVALLYSALRNTTNDRNSSGISASTTTTTATTGTPRAYSAPTSLAPYTPSNPNVSMFTPAAANNNTNNNTTPRPAFAMPPRYMPRHTPTTPHYADAASSLLSPYSHRTSSTPTSSTSSSLSSSASASSSSSSSVLGKRRLSAWSSEEFNDAVQSGTRFSAIADDDSATPAAKRQRTSYDITQPLPSPSLRARRSQRGTATTASDETQRNAV